MSQEKLPSKNTATRRNILTGLSLAIGIPMTDKLVNDGAVMQMSEDAFFDATRLDAPAFDGTPELENCVNRGRAWAVVHRGWLEGKKLRGANTDYDAVEYDAYMKRSDGLLNFLRRSGEPAILFSEDKSYQAGDVAIDPASCTSLAVTFNGAGHPKRFIRTGEGIREQNIDGIKGFLRRLGIGTVNFAGELARHKGIETGACVEGAASFFADDFDIKGVEGCIYPSTPGRQPNRIQRNLYFDTVRVPEA